MGAYAEGGHQTNTLVSVRKAQGNNTTVHSTKVTNEKTSTSTAAKPKVVTAEQQRLAAERAHQTQAKRPAGGLTGTSANQAANTSSKPVASKPAATAHKENHLATPEQRKAAEEKNNAQRAQLTGKAKPADKSVTTTNGLAGGTAEHHDAPKKDGGPKITANGGKSSTLEAHPAVKTANAAPAQKTAVAPKSNEQRIADLKQQKAEQKAKEAAAQSGAKTH